MHTKYAYAVYLKICKHYWARAPYGILHNYICGKNFAMMPLTCDWIYKTRNNPARIEVQIMTWHECHTLAQSKHTNDRATINKVCFHWHHFCDPVNS